MPAGKEGSLVCRGGDGAGSGQDDCKAPVLAVSPRAVAQCARSVQDLRRAKPALQSSWGAAGRRLVREVTGPARLRQPFQSSTVSRSQRRGEAVSLFEPDWPGPPHPLHLPTGRGGWSYHSDGLAEEPGCLSALSAGPAPSPDPVRTSRGVRSRHDHVILSASPLVEEVPRLERPSSPMGAEGSLVSGAA